MLYVKKRKITIKIMQNFNKHETFEKNYLSYFVRVKYKSNSIEYKKNLMTFSENQMFFCFKYIFFKIKIKLLF